MSDLSHTQHYRSNKDVKTKTLRATEDTGEGSLMDRLYDTNWSSQAILATIGGFGDSADTSYVYNFDGSIPGNAVIKGIKLRFFQLTNSTAGSNSVKLGCAISKDGQAGTYSSDIELDPISTNELTDVDNPPYDTDTPFYDFGGENELWGFDWTGFNDPSQLSVKMTSTMTTGSGISYVVSKDLQLIIYYTQPAGTLHLKQGTIKLSGGTFKF